MDSMKTVYPTTNTVCMGYNNNLDFNFSTKMSIWVSEVILKSILNIDDILYKLLWNKNKNKKRLLLSGALDATS